MKFSKLLSHARHNAIAYIALFVALGDTAAAASPYIRNGDPAGGDLTGTYPNPLIASGTVTSQKILDGTITAADVASANKDGAASTPSLRTQHRSPGPRSRRGRAAARPPQASSARPGSPTTPARTPSPSSETHSGSSI